jgi:ATP-dependent exoDNAse (exonuclease V) beta subunit
VGKVEEMKEYHVTDLMLWRSCPAKYYWQVEQRLRKPFEGVARPVGSAVHAGLEALYAGLSAPEAMNRALDVYREKTPPGVREGLERGELEKVEQGEIQVARCMQHYPFSPMDFKEVIGIEAVHKAYLGDERQIIGTVDRLVRTNGSTYVHDVKTTGLPVDKTARLQKIRMQYPAYVWLLKQNGVSVRGVIVDVN